MNSVVMNWNEVQQLITERFGWPSWAVNLIGSLLLLVLMATFLQQYVAAREFDVKSTHNRNNTTTTKVSISFRIFQLKYLSVYLITMLADWLQGTNMYTLYSVIASQFSDVSIHILGSLMELTSELYF